MLRTTLLASYIQSMEPVPKVAAIPLLLPYSAMAAASRSVDTSISLPGKYVDKLSYTSCFLSSRQPAPKKSTLFTPVASIFFSSLPPMIDSIRFASQKNGFIPSVATLVSRVSSINAQSHLVEPLSAIKIIVGISIIY